jgi:glycosyltransferase
LTTVSIITPAYNSAKTIADTVDSVARQTYNQVEHIIVDGASQDETLMIVRKRSKRATIISEPDDGIYDAMNKGVSQATGEIIGVLNSDDFYKNNDVIASVVEMFRTTGCEALYGNLVYVDNAHPDRVVRTWDAGAFEMGKFINGWMPPHPTFFVKRECYTKYGVYDTELRSSADYELMLRFLYRYKVKVAYLPMCMVCMRTGGQSNASLKNRLKANREDRLAWKKNGLQPRFYTTWLKPIRKIPQFIK